MGQVARSMNPSQDNAYDDILSTSDTSTISSGENSSTHSPDSTSNTMIMDKFAYHIYGELYGIPLTIRR
ncbi:unnamed protein product [Absidia cylindrospora]